MAFQFAYTQSGNAAGSVVKDYALDAAGNYGTGGVKKGDLVFLSAGLLRKVQAATATGTSIGVIEGQEFTGLVAQGQPYAATNSSFTAGVTDTIKNPNGVGKVRIDKSASIYKVPVRQAGATQTATNAHIGSNYNIILDANNDQQVDLNLQTAAHVKVVDFTPDGKYVFVSLV